MIVASKTFARQFEKLDAEVQQRVLTKVESLDRELKTRRHERLQGRSEYKLRVGNWRVLYDFNVSKDELLLLTVRHRSEVYR